MGEPMRLTVVPDDGEAEILCRLLRSEGIACGVRLADGATEAGYSFEGRREILVSEIDLPRARELMSAADLDVSCTECGGPIGDDGRWWSDGAGELHPYCAVCGEREFGAGA